MLSLLNSTGLKINSPIQVGERNVATFHIFFAIMAFTGFKSVMCGIQCLENKHNTDSEASVNHFPAQPAANQDYTEQFLLLLSPFTPFILEESECISHGLRKAPEAANPLCRIQQ